VTPLAQKVVRRFLARRAIPFDVNTVKREFLEMAEEAIDTAISMSPEGQPIGTMRSLARRTLRLPNVKVPGKAILVVISARPGPRSKPTAGGHFEKAHSTITLFLNANWTPEALSDQKWIAAERLQSFGIHEVTHALDVIREDMAYEGGEGDLRVYYNQPIEVRAYARQIVDEVVRGLKKSQLRSRRTKKPLPTGRDLIERLLFGQSETWVKIHEYLEPKNDRLIRQIVVRELQDAGLIE